MPDVHDPATRSRNMRAIRNKDTAPEMAVRRALHAAGFRYIPNDRTRPGRPDLVLPKRRAVVFVHGCFWHGHDCSRFKTPSKDWWREKIRGNAKRDATVVEDLKSQGWRVATVWECSLAGTNKRGIAVVARELGEWLRSDSETLDIREHCGPRQQAA